MNASANLFDEVVAASGLMDLIAPYAVSRLLISADVTPRELTSADLRRALPQLEQGLQVYLDAEQLERAIAALRALAKL